MIAYLVVNNGRPINKSTISQELWEDVSEKLAADNLYKAFASLKKSLDPFDHLPVISISNKFLLDTNTVSCDLWEFEKLYNLKNVTAWEKAEYLYTGALFGGAPYSWLIEYEGRYELMYYEIVEYLTSYYKMNDSPAKYKYYENRLNLFNTGLK